MHVIRSAEALLRLVATYPVLACKADLLAECEDLATVVVVQPHDTQDDLNQAFPDLLTNPAECVEHVDGWRVVTFILSDWGEGVIVFVPAAAPFQVGDDQ